MRGAGGSRRDLDRENLQAVLQLIGSCFPAAAVVVLETSDQNMGYGFFLVDVQDAGGLSLWEQVCDLPRERIRDLAEPFLMDIDWDGVIGEDEHGVGEVHLSGRVFGPPGESLDRLRADTSSAPLPCGPTSSPAGPTTHAVRAANGGAMTGRANRCR